MANYRISHNIRKYSTTPIIEVITEENGKETEKIVCVIVLPKKDGEIISNNLVKLLNQL
jgi:hypothetical protein